MYKYAMELLAHSSLVWFVILGYDPVRMQKQGRIGHNPRSTVKLYNYLPLMSQCRRGSCTKKTHINSIQILTTNIDTMKTYAYESVQCSAQ